MRRRQTSAIFKSRLLPTTFAAGETNHPYLANELLNKIYNTFTTRSNSFAIWITVGYFEVRNDGPYTDTNRPVLGKELDQNIGKNRRKRYFAIVDRTQLTTDPLNSKQQGMPVAYFKVDQPCVAGVPITVNVPAIASSGPANPTLTLYYDENSYQIQPQTGAQGGTQLLLDPAGNALAKQLDATAKIGPETVIVTATAAAGPSTPATITFTPANDHPAGITFAVAQAPPNNPTGTPTTPSKVGHPGPQQGFDYTNLRYQGVVRVMEVIPWP